MPYCRLAVNDRPVLRGAGPNKNRHVSRETFSARKASADRERRSQPAPRRNGADPPGSRIMCSRGGGPVRDLSRLNGSRSGARRTNEPLRRRRRAKPLRPVAPLMNCRRCLDPRSGVRFFSAHSVSNPTARTPHHASPKTGRFDRPDLRHGWIPCAYRPTRTLRVRVSAA
jgi:hypothetical protein